MARSRKAEPTLSPASPLGDADGCFNTCRGYLGVWLPSRPYSVDGRTRFNLFVTQPNKASLKVRWAVLPAAERTSGTSKTS